MEKTSVINDLNKPKEVSEPLKSVALSLCAETQEIADSWIEAIMRFHNC